MKIEEIVRQKLKEKSEKWTKQEEEHSYVRLEYLKTKVIYEALLNLSLFETNLNPNLLVNKKKWIPIVQNSLLNGKECGKLEPSLIKSLQDAVKVQLTEQCQVLMEHYGDESEDYSKLPFLVQTDIETVKENDPKQQRKKEIDQEIKRKNLLQDHVEMTHELVQNHALGHVSQLNKLNVKYYSDKKKILQQRIRSKEAEVLHQTYTPEAIKALSKIHHELKEKTIEESKRLDQLKYQLEQYSSLGEDFANLAKKYAEILKDIQDKEWMMKAINDSRE